MMLAKECSGDGQGVLVQRVDGLHALGEACREVGASRGERRADAIGEVRCVFRIECLLEGPPCEGSERSAEDDVEEEEGQRPIVRRRWSGGGFDFQGPTPCWRSLK